jgi:hypothetical protein
MTESSQAPLLKSDVLGHVRTPAARREQLLDEFERSGTVVGQTFAELQCSQDRATPGCAVIVVATESSFDTVPGRNYNRTPLTD